MNYLTAVHWLLLLLSTFAVVPAATLLSPVRVSVRATPGLMIAAAIGLYFLPLSVLLAISVVGPCAWLFKVFGVSVSEEEPVDYSPATEKARNGLQAARERVKKAKPDKVTEFAKRAYPDPEKADSDAVDSVGNGGEADEPTNSTDVKPGKPFDWRAAMNRNVTKKYQEPGAAREQLRQQYAEAVSRIGA